MADVKISALPPSGALIAGDVTPVVNGGITAKATMAQIATFVGAGSSPPFVDTQTIIKGSADATKLLRFEVDGFTAGVTNILTPPNQNATIAGTNVIQTFSVSQTFSPGNDLIPVVIQAASVTGAGTSAFLDIAGTWNTTGAPAAIKLNVTNTASDAASCLLDLQIGGAHQLCAGLPGKTTNASLALNSLMVPSTLQTWHAGGNPTPFDLVVFPSTGGNNWGGVSILSQGTGAIVSVGTTAAWPYLELVKYGGTTAAPTAVSTSWMVGEIAVLGYNGATYDPLVMLDFVTTSGNARSGQLNMAFSVNGFTSAPGAAAPVTFNGSNIPFTISVSAGALTTYGNAVNSNNTGAAGWRGTNSSGNFAEYGMGGSANSNALLAASGYFLSDAGGLTLAALGANAIRFAINGLAAGNLKWSITSAGVLLGASGSNFTLVAANIATDTTTGTKIGTATTQKFSFWNKTPIIQPTNAIAAAAFVANTSAIANDTATFGGYTIGQITAALIAVGILT